MDHEFVNAAANVGLNEYVYLPGGNVNNAQRNGPCKISVKENGPLVASLLVESDAPGCNKLLREIRLVNGLDRVEIIDTIDKKAVRSVEGVHIGFGFNVPNAARAHQHSVGRDPAREGPACRRVQELVFRRAMG